MAYEEIDPSIWTYKNDGDFIEGVFIKAKDDVGPNKSMLYTIETSEGVKNVWGATILDEKMSVVNVGDKIKIVYKGLGTKKPSQNAPKMFQVFKDVLEVQKSEPEVPVQKIS